MKFEKTNITDDLVKVKLEGSLDISGAGEIEMPMNLAAGKHDKIIVDFTSVDFLASIGIRILVKSAKAVANRDGKLVIFGASEMAQKVLVSTGIDALIPIVADETEAVEAFS